MKKDFRAYKIVIWVLSTMIVLLMALSIILFIDGNKRNFETNLTDELEILVDKTGLNLASIYFPNSLVGNTSYTQKLKLSIGENITGLKLKMLASNVNNTNAQGEVSLILPEVWEREEDYYVFNGEIISGSSMEVDAKLMLPKLNGENSKTAIISVVIMAN